MRKRTKMLLFFFSFLLTLNLSAQDVGKKFSLTLKNESMSSVFKRIEKVSGVNILFAYEDVNTYKVTETLTNVTAEEAVRKVIGKYPLTYVVKENGKYISVTKKEVAVAEVPAKANLPVKKVYEGVVVDEADMPLIGVAVTISGVSNFGVATDIDGHFLMEVPEDKSGASNMLVFSYIGMNTETVRGGVK